MTQRRSTVRTETPRTRAPLWRRGATAALAAMCAVAGWGGCYKTRSSKGGGEVKKLPEVRRPSPRDVSVPDGYAIEVVASGLTFPTGVAFGDSGEIYVTESGYSYGEVFRQPRVLEVMPGGGKRVVASGDNGPWNGIVAVGNTLYVAEGGVTRGGRILRIELGDGGGRGKIRALVEGLPSLGDHHTNGPVLGPDGWLYFGQGTATNSAVVGTDNHDFGWLARHPDFHDVPCRDVTLTGQNFETANPLTPDRHDRAVTGAYSPFGQRTEAGQVIAGRVPCSGAIMRVRPEGGAVELVAWGLRNPYGLAFDERGKLYVTDNSYDERGSRPVFGAGDLLWQIEPGAWYGWPDYWSILPLTDGRFHQVGEKPRALIVSGNQPPPRPAALLAVHSSSTGFDFSRSDRFGYAGDAFVAQFGDQAPVVGKVLGPVGYKVVRVNVRTGVSQDFARNSRGQGPASRVGGGGLERPIAARFDRSGQALYVVDFGILTMSEKGSAPRAGTGTLWRITREKAR